MRDLRPRVASGAPVLKPLAVRGAVRVQSVQVDRTPGVPDAFAVETLSPGLTLLFGPNASGKSSLLRALDALLWAEPPATARAVDALSARARFTSDGDTWDVRLDGASCTTYTSEGVRAAPPRWPARALRHRLHIALHELLPIAREADQFAAAIVRASAGGLDVREAGAQVGMSAHPPRQLRKRGDFDAAVRALRDAQQRQQALYTESQQLTEHRAAKETADRARHALRTVEQARAWRDATRRVAESEAALAELPAALAQWRGHEPDRARDAWEAWQRAQAQWRTAVAARAAATDALAALWPDGAPTAEQRDTWQGAVRALRAATTAEVQARTRLAEATTARDAAWQLLNSTATPPEGVVDRARVAEAAALATRLETAMAATMSAVAYGESIPDDPLTAARPPHEPPAEPDQWRDGLRLLTEWLAADAVRSSPTSAPDTLAHWGLLVLAVAGWLVAALLVHPAFWIGTVCAVALALWRRPRVDASVREAAADRCRRAESAFAQLGVAAPSSWTADAVLHSMTRLALALGDHRWVEHVRGERARSSTSVARARETLASVQQEMAAFAERTGLLLDGEGRTLGWLLDRLVRWQDASLNVATARASHTEAQREVTEALALLADAPGAPPSITHAEAMLSVLTERTEQQEARQRDLREAERDAARAREACVQHAAVWQSVFAALALEAPPLPEVLVNVTPAHTSAAAHALAQLEQLAEQHPHYAQHLATRANAVHDLQQVEALVTDRDTFNAWCRHSEAALLAEHERLQAEAEQFEARVHAVSALETRLDAAGRAHEVEAALAQRAVLRDALQEEAERVTRELVTHTLVTHLEAWTQEAQRPAVFRRARELFAQLTRGRWQLHLADARGVPHFSAEDTRTGVHHAPDTLSAGTRVQLLVAVRVAFVESEESDGVRLPLFFDETLGTSDDERSDALIDAVLTLVAQGRQVFYATAQRDEVAKWRAALQARARVGAPIAWGELDLAAVRRLATDTVRTDVPPPQPPRELPTWALASHAAFGAATNVPPVDIGRQPVSAWPLWYLTTDVALLHAAWRLGMERWGEFAWFVESGGTLSIDGVSDAELAMRMDAVASVATLGESLHRLSAIGRGRPVDRSVLEASDAISETFLDPVTELARSVGGDARQLLERLEAGAVPRWRRSVQEKLEAFLRANGYLDDADPLAPEAIRLGMIAESSHPDAAALVDALLERLALTPSANERT